MGGKITSVTLAMFGVDTPAVVGDDADVAGVMGEGDGIWLSGAAADEVGTDEGDVRVLLFSGDICDVSAAAALYGFMVAALMLW